MVTLLECVERIPSVLETILSTRKENFAPLLGSLKNGAGSIDEIILVGSGTSNTVAVTSRIFVEKAAGVRVTPTLPTDLMYNTGFYNPSALYVFTSQTGSSIEVRAAQKLVRDKGFATVAITEAPTTPVAREAAAHVNMNSGNEEYPMRTIGYSASVFTHMMLGLEMGLENGHLTRQAYDTYLDIASAVPNSHRAITTRAMKWMDTAKRQMLRSQLLMFCGPDALHGVAQEAAMKVWEIPQIASTGWELEESLHGPNYGYNQNHCVIVLNHGGREGQKGTALARWMKDVHKNGLVIGAPVVDEADFPIELKGGDFDCLEIAPVVQVLAYRLAEDGGRDLFAPHDNSVMERYFKTHQEEDAKP